MSGSRDDGSSGLRGESLRLTFADILGIVFGFAVCFFLCLSGNVVDHAGIGIRYLCRRRDEGCTVSPATSIFRVVGFTGQRVVSQLELANSRRVHYTNLELDWRGRQFHSVALEHWWLGTRRLSCRANVWCPQDARGRSSHATGLPVGTDVHVGAVHHTQIGIYRFVSLARTPR